MIKIDIKKLVRRCSQAIMLLPNVALAAGYGDGSESDFDGAIEHLISFLTGNLAHLISVLGIIVVGYLWLGTGQIPKKYGIGVIGGIAFINGAAWLGSYFWGS